MNLAIVSGKGGTGKTTLASNLAAYLSRQRDVRLLDADAEEPNAVLFFRADIHRDVAVSVMVPEILHEKCTRCRKCVDICEYNALMMTRKGVLLSPDLCHSCKACMYVCPEKAILEKPREIGRIREYVCDGYPRLHVIEGDLHRGESRVTPVIDEVLSYAGPCTIVDAPPGTSCPVVETVKHADRVLVVTESTPFGLHDLKGVASMLRLIRRPFQVVINRHGQGDNGVETWCREEGIPVLLKIPFREDYANVIAGGGLLIEHFPRFREDIARLAKDMCRKVL
ncbi:MAG: (4Fe-4S)-binding protein [Candidatus Neomarinimicrobiota bacterium]|nr:ATP-binding protein [Candidatus Neomarinimicrobiota bacterium]RKY51031.1 MAG: (4Fe-4S)-binding protein [Candidatus Neomarinimicrobiota bacterium]